MFSRPHNVAVCHIGVAVYCIILRLIFFTALGRVSVDCDSVPLVEGVLWCWVLTVLRLVVVLGVVLRVARQVHVGPRCVESNVGVPFAGKIFLVWDVGCSIVLILFTLVLRLGSFWWSDCLRCICLLFEWASYSLSSSCNMYHYKDILEMWV